MKHSDRNPAMPADQRPDSEEVPLWRRVDDEGRPIARSGSFADGREPIRGISDLVAIALCAMQLTEVHRSTIRMLMPEGKSRRQVTVKVSTALSRFEKYGWVRRTRSTVMINNRAGLLSWVTQGADYEDDRAATLLRVRVAARDIEQILATEADDNTELRRLELLALKRLMEDAPGAHSKGRGAVRLIPRGGAL